MTGTEIQSYVESRLGRTLSPDDILLAINECLDEIADLALLYATIDLDVTDGTQWYELPEDFSTIEHLIIYDNGEHYYEGWIYRNGSIRIPDAGSYKIVARKMPDYLNDIAEPINNLHRMYNNAVKYYVLSWIRENEDLDDQISEKYYQKFTEKVQRAASSLISTKSPAKVQVIRRA